MKPRRATAAFLFLILTTTLWVSCKKSLHTEDERYVFVTANVDLPYWQEAQAGFMDAAQVLGVKAEFTGPKIYSPDDELKTFEQAVASHPTGILVSPARAALFKAAIDSAIKAGVPVICVDSDSPDSDRILFIGTDNYEVGVKSGSLLAEKMRGSGLVVVITIPGQFNLDERLRGAKDAFAKNPGIKITETINDKGDPQQATAAVADFIRANKRVDGILCLEASGGPGAARAVDQFGKAARIPILAMDKNPDTLDWIKTGAITATIAQKPYTMSYYGLKFLDDLHHNVVHQFKDWRTAPASVLPRWVDTGLAVVNDRNVEDFAVALVEQRRRK